MSRRQMDMTAEQELAKYLDEYFYARMVSSGKLSSADRIYEANCQKSGIDVIAAKNESVAYIDEKAQLYYINKNLPTFAFELGFSINGARRAGWLLNDGLATTHYFLLWPEATTPELASLTKDKFTSVEGMMVKKADLRAFLDKAGLDVRTLTQIEQKLREKQTFGRYASPINGIYFYVSDTKKYSEAPINLIIGKQHLLKIASGHYRITPERLDELIRKAGKPN